MQANRIWNLRGIAIRCSLLILSVTVSFFLAELICRYHYYGNLSGMGKTPESRFIRYDENMGWSAMPNSEGYFTNPKAGFNGYVKYDVNGIRINGNNYNYDGDSILIIGDSVTAGLEVDNDKTYIADLERLLFHNGCKYRVYNAGVRGYGTDQSLWNLERLIAVVKPKYVIYMFNSTDFRDNKTIKQSNRKYGKPVYVLHDGEIKLMNRPAKEFEFSYYAFVEYGADGYKIREGYMNDSLRAVMDYIKNNLALYLPLKILYKRLQISPTAALDETVSDYDLQVLEQILKHMKNTGVELYLTSFPYEGEEVYINDFMRISDKQGITYLNLFPYFTEPWEIYHWKRDKHWNEKGHLQAATALFELLNPILCN
jgi:hypothetical protein